MKNLFLVVTSLIISFLSNFNLNGQGVYTTTFNGAKKQVVIVSSTNDLSIEGIKGDQVIIESLSSKKELPKEAEGLKIVTGGIVDNTKIGASAVLNGDILKITIPKSNYYQGYKIKIPENLDISVKENGNAYGKWEITGINGEVEVKTTYTNLTINEVTGPIVARCGYGKLKIVFSQLNQSKPNSIYANGVVDVSLPASTKANLKLNATYADIFTDFEIMPMNSKVDTLDNKQLVKISTPKKTNQTFELNEKKADIDQQNAENAKNKSEQMRVSNKNYQIDTKINTNIYWSDPGCDDCHNDSGSTGIINGGGVNLTIQSDYGNVYLRKKK